MGEMKKLAEAMEEIRVERLEQPLKLITCPVCRRSACEDGENMCLRCDSLIYDAMMEAQEERDNEWWLA